MAGYQREEVPLRDLQEERVFGTALTWVATASNPNFLGMAPPAEMARQINGCKGPSGSNREYVLQLASALASWRTYSRLLPLGPLQPLI